MTRWNRYPLSRPQLVKLRDKAHRRSLWFKVLNRAERGLMDLAIKIVKRVRSLVLARSLISVVKKLKDAMESEVTYLMRTVGRVLAHKLSEIFQGWGNKSAQHWAKDLDFIQYLAVMQKNLSPVFRA